MDNNHLEKFLLNSKYSLSREKMINYKIFYDIKLAAARYGEEIEIYTSEIDQNGYDMIIISRDSATPFQIKTRFGKTRNWSIQKQLLRPKKENIGLLGYDFSPAGNGLGGGFILVEIIIEKEAHEPSYKYYYTDCFILHLISEGFIEFKNEKKFKSASKAIVNLQNGLKKDKISISKSSMVQVRSIKDLLVCSSTLSFKRDLFLKSYLREYYDTGNERIREKLISLLKSVVTDPRIKKLS